jgi:hypothetical protein
VREEEGGRERRGRRGREGEGGREREEVEISYMHVSCE